MDLRNQRIANSLKEMFDKHIDMSDVKRADEYENKFLSRAIAALSLCMLIEATPSESGQSVTDGYKDMGLDLVHYDETSSTLFLVQSKWINDADGCPDTGSILKFLDGVDNVLNISLDNANAKIIDKKQAIETAVRTMRQNIVLLLSYTGKQQLGDEAKEILDKFMFRVDEGSKELISYKTLNQQDIYKYLSDGNEGHSVDDNELVISNWGKIDEPYVSYYGIIPGKKLVELYSKHGQKLFSRNIRYFKGDTEVNDGIVKVLKDEPENFFYYNNGIKVICKSITKAGLAGTDTKIGLFHMTGMNIVNGAQTTGAIFQAANTHNIKLDQVRVFAHFIDLEYMPEGYDVLITKLSNTQNRIESKDFAALDKNQERIRQELKFEHIDYLYKSGSTLNNKESQLTFDEALVALACYHDDPTHTGTAKRNVGALATDVAKAPYKLFFSSGTSSYLIWNLVQIMRIVDSVLSTMETRYEKKDRLILVHGNRFILHVVYQASKAKFPQIAKSVLPSDDIKSFVNNNVDTAARVTQERFFSLFGENCYPATVFKNIGHIRDLLKQPII